MANCSGNCGSCGGCARELVLSPEEMAFLEQLGQIPFQPLARNMGDDIPVSPEEPTEERTALLQCMHKKGLISLDYDLPMKGIDYGPYRIRGSLALTERGQKVLELLELQGFHQE